MSAQTSTVVSSDPLVLESVACCVCAGTASEPVGVGEDFEYGTSPDSFLAVRCQSCSLVYLDPRPALSELDRIYPDTYHAYSFDEDHFGLAYKVRCRLEARRLLRACRGLPADARILDVGCGDGFHLQLLVDRGKPGWRLEGVDVDARAVTAARGRGLRVHEGTVENLDLAEEAYDLVLMIATIEHVADPPAVLRAVHRLLKRGRAVLVVTDNTGSLDFRLSHTRHWGGYHFPRHWNLFDNESMRKLAAATAFQVEDLRTITSPVNWTYTVRNALQDWGAPRRVVEQFSLSSPVALAAFTVFDLLHVAIGRGALLRAVLRKP